MKADASRARASSRKVSVVPKRALVPKRRSCKGGLLRSTLLAHVSTASLAPLPLCLPRGGDRRRSTKSASSGFVIRTQNFCFHFFFGRPTDKEGLRASPDYSAVPKKSTTESQKSDVHRFEGLRRLSLRRGGRPGTLRPRRSSQLLRRPSLFRGSDAVLPFNRSLQGGLDS